MIRRRLVPLVLCLVAGVVGALLLTHGTAKVYESTAQVFVNVPSATSVQNGVQAVQLSSDLLPSYAEIATSRATVAKVRERLGVPDSVESLRSRISASALPQKRIIEITAKDGDPVRARSLANAATAALADTVTELESNRAPSAAVQLQVIDPAVRGHQVAPRPTYDLVLGIVLGLGSGLALALVLDALDRSVKTGPQAEGTTRSPVLGVVPRLDRGQRSRPLPDDDPVAEAYRSLRTGVRFADPDQPVRVVMVTSAESGEGKTTTAVNLAIALAQSGERTVLVDADLRRPGVAAMLGIEGAVGVSSVVTRSAALHDALQTWQHGLLVLPSGALPPNPSEIVGSQAMTRLLADLDDYADTIVVDAPPVLPVTDAVVLATQVESVLLVVRAGKTQRGQAVEARRRLDGVGAHVVGSVLNGVKRSTAAGYYAAYRPITQRQQTS